MNIVTNLDHIANFKMKKKMHIGAHNETSWGYNFKTSDLKHIPPFLYPK